MRRIYSGHALQRAGPAGLLIVVVAQNTILGMVNNYLAEMCIYMPLSGGFVRMAGKWADGAFGFMAGWNFFFYQAIMPVLYCGWKVVHKTKLVKPTEADLTWDALEIAAYEETTSGTDKPAGFLRDDIALFTCGKRKKRDGKPRSLN